MPIEIQEPFRATVPEGAIIGVIGLKGSGKSALVRSIADTHPGSRMIVAGETLNLTPAPLLLLDTLFGDALAQARTVAVLEQLRRGGSTVFIATHDEGLLLRIADEVWWMNEGHLAAKGDAREIVGRYRGFVATRMAEWGRSAGVVLDTSRRRGNGHAEIVALETLDFAGAPSAVLRSGEAAAIRVSMRFREAVENAVVGIMIRTRVGTDVYGTNTELEGLKLPSRAAGESLQLQFRFNCELCPGDYTVTVACHDPEGTPHDWLDDAVAFAVTDSRYTAGVANLHAQVQIL